MSMQVNSNGRNNARWSHFRKCQTSCKFYSGFSYNEKLGLQHVNNKKKTYQTENTNQHRAQTNVTTETTTVWIRPPFAKSPTHYNKYCCNIYTNFIINFLLFTTTMGRGYFAECGLRNAESCQGVICGKSSAERSAKYPLSVFRIPQPKIPYFRIIHHGAIFWRLDLAWYNRVF